jgi:hypothetical protein
VTRCKAFAPGYQSCKNPVTECPHCKEYFCETHVVGHYCQEMPRERDEESQSWGNFVRYREWASDADLFTYLTRDELPELQQMPWLKPVSPEIDVTVTVTRDELSDIIRELQKTRDEFERRGYKFPTDETSPKT